MSSVERMTKQRCRLSIGERLITTQAGLVVAAAFRL